MQKTAITTRQSFYVSMPILIIMGHFFLVPVYLRFAGRDAWLGVIGGILLGAVIFAAMGKLQERLYGKTLVEWSIQWFGPWFGRIVTLPLIIYFFVLSFITLYGFSVFIDSEFLTEHPRWAIAIPFALAVIYMVHKGIEVIARVSEWILIYNIVTGIMVSLSLIDKKDYSKLLPMLGYGLRPVIPVTILVLAVFGELIAMLMVNVRKPDAKSFSHSKMYWILFVANLFILPSSVAGPVAIFGPDQAKLLMFPVESMVRLINVGFIERFDIYGLTIMTVSALLRLALLQYATSVAITQWLSLKDYKWINAILGVGLAAASLLVFDNYIDLLKFLQKYYAYGIVASGLILLLWIVTSIASAAKKKSSGDSAGQGSLG